MGAVESRFSVLRASGSQRRQFLFHPKDAGSSPGVPTLTDAGWRDLRVPLPGMSRELLAAAPGVELIDDPAANRFPMPTDVTGRDPARPVHECDALLRDAEGAPRSAQR